MTHHARDSTRPRRIAGLIQREIAELLAREIKDPRLLRVTISQVDVSPDLAHARVYVTFPEGRDVRKGLGLLQKASRFLRRRLGERIRLRALPRLEFRHDDALATGLRISALIDDALSPEGNSREAGGAPAVDSKGR